MTDVKNVVKQDRCEPQAPPPDPAPQEKEMCEGAMEGTISGTLRVECGCNCCLMTRTFIINIGPQTEAQLIQYLQNTVNAYENSGYKIMAHSIADIGAGWLLGLTVGWYA